MTRAVLRLILAAPLLVGGARGLAAQEVVYFRAQQLRECARLGVSFDFRPDVLVVQDLIPGSPADRAGIRPGDVVVRIDDAGADPARLSELARSLEPGNRVRLRVRRAGTERTIDLVAVKDLCAQQVIVTEDPVALRRTLRELDPRGYVIRLDTVRVDMDTVWIRYLARERVELDSLRTRLRSTYDSLRTRQIAAVDSVWAQRRRLTDSLNAMQRRTTEETARLHRIVRTPTVVVVGDGAPPGFSVLDGFELGRRAVAGAEFTELNPALAQYFEGASQGLLVLSTAPETPGARAGLQPGDIIVRANGSPMRTVQDLRLAIVRAGRQPTTLNVIRKGRPLELRLFDME